jgi:hypothetical protein
MRSADPAGRRLRSSKEGFAVDGQPISFAGVALDRPRHICAFFNSEEDEYRTLLPFIADGFRQGQKAVHVVEPERQHTHLRHLTGAGIDVGQAQKSGQLALHLNTEIYLREGRFDTDRMLQAFEAMASGAAQGPFGISRILCQMGWAGDHPGCIHDLITFEARVNDVWRRHDDAVICVYDLARFGGDTVMDILRTHPLTIVGGILQRNPFFVPPEEFLPQLLERHATGNPSLKAVV